jgi:hypothetical protein
VEYLTIKNFEKFQHYKERNPPWIKIHRELFLDYEFGCLQDASKLHLMLIWLLASQLDNKIPNNPEFVKEQIHVKEEVDLNLLISKGFLIPLASCKQDASKVLTKNAPEAYKEEAYKEETEEQYTSQQKPEQIKNKREKKYDKDDLEFAEKMASDIQSWSSSFKNPSLENWAEDIRKFRENEKTSFQLIKQTWTAIQADSPTKHKIGTSWKGWRSVVLSPSKFRKQYVSVRASLNLDNASVQNSQGKESKFVSA